MIAVAGPCQDGTDAVLAAHPWVRVGHCPERRLGLSRNIGIAMAAGDVVAFIDDDAVPFPDYLERIAEGYSDPAVGAVGGFTHDTVLDRLDWRHCTCTLNAAVEIDAQPPLERFQAPGADPFLYLPGCVLSVRRELLVAVGGFDERLVYCYDDADVCRRVANLGSRVVSRPEAMVYHGYAASASRDAKRVVHDAYAILFCQVIFVAGRPPAVQFWADFWRRLGDGHLAEGTFTAEHYARYLARIEDAVRDGADAAAMERPVAAIPPTDMAAWQRVGCIPSPAGGRGSG